MGTHIAVPSPDCSKMAFNFITNPSEKALPLVYSAFLGLHPSLSSSWQPRSRHPSKGIRPIPGARAKRVRLLKRGMERSCLPRGQHANTWSQRLCKTKSFRHSTGF